MLVIITLIFFVNIPGVIGIDPSSITCEVSNWQIYLGESLLITGTIDPLYVGVEVTLTFTDPTDTVFNRTTSTTSGGDYDYTISPYLEGMWSVHASWIGNENTMGNASSDVKFLVSTNTEVTIKIGQNQTIYHTFQPAIDYYYSTISIDEIALDGSATSPASIILSALGGGYTYEKSQFSMGGTIVSYNLTCDIQVVEGTPEGVYYATAYYDIYSQSTLYPYSSSLLFRYELRFKINAVTVLNPLAVSILLPGNTIYAVNQAPLNFTVTEPTSWMGYSLDEQTEVTIAGNTTLTNLSDGTHSVVVYANDIAGNTATSIVVSFTVDTTPPTISGITQNPSIPYDDDPVAVTVRVTDQYSGVNTVTLLYRKDGGSWVNIEMTETTEDIYEATIPSLSEGTEIEYRIVANDVAGHQAAEDNAELNYSYAVIPEFPSLLILLLSVIPIVAVIAYRRKLASKKNIH